VKSANIDCDSISPENESTDACIMAFSKSSGNKNHSAPRSSGSFEILVLRLGRCLEECLRVRWLGGKLPVSVALSKYASPENPRRDF